MNKTSISRSEPLDEMTGVWARASRIVLILTAVIVSVMPLTEYLWHFDNFPRGGQDFELGLLAVATFTCFVLVMLRQGKHGITSMLAVRRWIDFIVRHGDDPAPGMFCGLVSDLQSIAIPSPVLGRNPFPIQI